MRKIKYYLIAEEDAAFPERGVVHPGVASEVDDFAIVGKREFKGEEEEFEGVTVFHDDRAYGTEVLGHLELQFEREVCCHWQVPRPRPVQNLHFRASQTLPSLCKKEFIYLPVKCCCCDLLPCRLKES